MKLNIPHPYNNMLKFQNSCDCPQFTRYFLNERQDASLKLRLKFQ